MSATKGFYTPADLPPWLRQIQDHNAAYNARLEVQRALRHKMLLILDTLAQRMARLDMLAQTGTPGDVGQASALFEGLMAEVETRQ